MLRIGAVAYAPYVVTIFEGLKRHFHREGSNWIGSSIRTTMRWSLPLSLAKWT